MSILLTFSLSSEVTREDYIYLREHCMNIRMEQVEPKAESKAESKAEPEVKPKTKFACQAVAVAAVDQLFSHLLTLHSRLLLQC